ncbi:MAG: hypothetical protein HKN21_11250 [Candidatus Eisenbacteria bacterium]|uniref:Outer membrane protein beta-barrel domain-containing protein n=1 Tax=Eiseniibacteriota bacterium TaxID=2212470 RepID=A0A7Y2H314_UNCEI|nr:hypothetical protein [Candidatus Eisenbacteria bacterium]
MKHCFLLALLIGAVFFVSDATAGSRVQLELLGGAVQNAGTPLTLKERGQPDLEFTASFRSEPFVSPIYYAIRIGLADSPWRLEFNHHKLFLEHPPEPIDFFSVTHGFNIVTLQYTKQVKMIDLRVGAGPVFGHPESTVRGRSYDQSRGILGTGYRVIGPALLLGAGTDFELSERFSLVGEGRSTVAPVHVPVNGGSARFTNVAFHFLFGLGVRF